MTGDIRHHRNFHSRFLASDHDLIVYVPPQYAEEPDRRFPVFYLQDGQNLFDPQTAFGGQEWFADETAETLIRNGEVAPVILVGVYNAGVKRIDEYTPSHDRRTRQGGQAHLYGRMVVQEIKNFVDREYRTLADAANTGLGGSSLGGLVTLAVGLKYPKIFGKLGVMSPSVWWNGRFILRQVEEYNKPPSLKIWLDTGTEEGSSPEAALRDVRELRNALLGKGWRLGENLAYCEDEGAGHNEQAWAHRFAPMLRFLFPPE